MYLQLTFHLFVMFNYLITVSEMEPMTPVEVGDLLRDSGLQERTVTAIVGKQCLVVSISCEPILVYLFLIIHLAHI